MNAFLLYIDVVEMIDGDLDDEGMMEKSKALSRKDKHHNLDQNHKQHSQKQRCSRRGQRKR